PVLEARVETHHSVVHLVDADPRPEEVGGEDGAAVRQSDLSVLDRVGPWLTLLLLQAVREVYADSRSNFLVKVIVAKGPVQTELSSRRQPLQHVRLRVESVVQLRRADAKGAQVVGEHRHVLVLGEDLALEPDTGRVRATEKLVRNQSIVHAEPERKLPF